MDSLLANTTSFDNELTILKAKSSLTKPALYVGGYAQGGLNYVGAAQPTYFYSINRTYKNQFYPSFDRVALASLVNVNSWFSAYFEGGATDLGQNYVSAIGINQFYVLLGGNDNPFYSYFGYKNIDFGSFSTVNIFAQPITRWDYGGTALTGGVGIMRDGFNLTVSGLRHGTQGAEDYYGAGLWRVHIFPNYYSDNAINFSVNTNYSFVFKNSKCNIGAGYIRGLWLGNPANSFDNSTIGAWDINTQINYSSFTLLAEYVQSTPRTNNFGEFITSNKQGIYLKTWDIGASYYWNDFLLPRTSTVSVDVSSVVGNTSFAQATQWVFGLSNNITKNVKTGIEYVREIQSSNESANRSGLFYRQHDKVQLLRLDVTASF